MIQNSKKVTMFVGKGGVGKTTISAATALHHAMSSKKTLIISTDPAPSLSDIFEKNARDREVEVYDKLWAIELSFDEVLRRWKKKFGDEIYRVMTSFASFDRSIIDYVGNAPGIDEEFMLDYVHEIFKSQRYEKIVWDTAPTGHTLRLLRLPVKFAEHLDRANSVYLNIFSYIEKIKGAIKGTEDAFQIIRSWKKLAEETIDFITSDNVGYTAITIPEALSIYQTRRLIDEFQDFGLVLNEIIVNNVSRNAPGCSFCESRKLMQERYVNEIEQTFKNVVVKKVPMFAYEIKGIGRIKDIIRFIL